MSDHPLHLLDAEVAADLATYASRARTLEEDGAMRLQAFGQVLAAYVGVRKGRGLMGEGTAVGLRVLPLASPSDIDVVVPLSAVLDRLAYQRNEAEPVLEIPPVSVRTSWAAVSPPRSGWSPLGEVSIASLLNAARAGIEEIAKGTPSGAGAAAVESLRHRVWERPIDGLPATVDGLPAAAALGLYALGFGIGDDAQVFGTARWHRVSTAVGHVLVR